MTVILHTVKGAMGRIREYTKVGGKKCWTLFDSGAQNSYVAPNVARLLVTKKLSKPLRTAIGGGVKKTSTAAILETDVEGHKILPTQWSWTKLAAMKKARRSTFCSVP